MPFIYFISGLGADFRAFRFLDLEGIPHAFIDWLPVDETENLQRYAQRLATLITEPEPVIVGLSMGGMLATEIARIVPVKKVILLSSANGCREIPWYLKVAGRLGIHKLVPVRFFQWPNAYANWLMGVRQQEHAALLAAFQHSADPEFIRWAVHNILTWRGSGLPYGPECVHIHGSKDHVLPLRYVYADFVIENGGHLMIMDKAEEVSRILRHLLHPVEAATNI